MKFIFDRLYRRFVRRQWVIGFFPAGGDDVLSSLRAFNRETLGLIYPPRDRFYADPFVVFEGGSYFIFYEELQFSDNRGVLKCMRLTGGELSPPRTILSKSYHLSYPQIFNWEGQYYMIPETAGNQSIDLYECTEFPYRWTYVRTLYSGLKLVDATLLHRDGLWLLIACDSFYTTRSPYLYLLSAPDLHGPWSAERLPTPDHDAVRSAGALITDGERLLRPVQVGGKRYGNKIRLNEITALAPGRLDERTVAEIEPGLFGPFQGLHTINQAGDLIFVDLNRELLPLPVREGGGPRLHVPDAAPWLHSLI